MFLLVLLALVVTTLVMVLFRRHAQLLPAGSQAPSFSLQGDDGRTHSLLPTVTVIEFFETTCPHCQSEAPRLCQLTVQHPEVAVIGIDAALEGVDKLRQFRRDHLGGCPGPDNPLLLLDPGTQVTHHYLVSVVPTVYVIDARGHVVSSHGGAGGIDGVPAVLDQLRTHG
jgi:thiol-disulfide isomerase/thioredoxin